MIILGAGGQAGVLIDCILAGGANKSSIIGITDPQSQYHGTKLLSIPIIGDDKTVFDYEKDDIRLVNALGAMENNKRKLLFEHFRNKGYSFSTIIHPSAVISRETVFDEGVQIMAGAVIQPGCHIADNVLINTMTSIDHDCKIGKNVHISPGATICGGVHIEDGVFIGPGTTIIKGIKIGANSLIGAGSLVLSDVKPGSKVYGVPAKEV